MDWLRCSAMLMVFLFHCARFFDDHPWHVKNSQISPGMSAFVGFLVLWIMPIFFILSGMSSFYSLRRRTARQFLKARFRRLAIPFIFGIFVLIPPQVYLERLSHGQFQGSFFRFFPHYFDGFYAFGGNFAWMGLHLWFLEILFVYSLLMLPLFLWIRQKKVLEKISHLADVFLIPGIIFLMGIPLAVIEASLNPEGLGMRDFGGWNIFQYMLFFIYGYFLATHDQFRKGIEKNRAVALILGIVATLTVFLELFSMGYHLTMIFRAFASWFWLVAILGFGSRYLRAGHSFLKKANEAVLPFYILHQTVILLLGYFIIQLNTPILVKYLIIGLLSFVSIVALYICIIRRFRITRFLFGMN